MMERQCLCLFICEGNRKREAETVCVSEGKCVSDGETLFVCETEGDR